MRLFWGTCAWVALGVGSALAANAIVSESQSCRARPKASGT